MDDGKGAQEGLSEVYVGRLAKDGSAGLLDKGHGHAIGRGILVPGLLEAEGAGASDTCRKAPRVVMVVVTEELRRSRVVVGGVEAGAGTGSEVALEDIVNAAEVVFDKGDALLEGEDGVLAGDGMGDGVALVVLALDTEGEAGRAEGTLAVAA